MTMPSFMLSLALLVIGFILIDISSCSHPQRLAPECLDLPPKCR
jgi:hypothetical protein